MVAGGIPEGGVNWENERRRRIVSWPGLRENPNGGFKRPKVWARRKAMRRLAANGKLLRKPGS